ncbi:MAG: DNA gyrase/topoisomerase IV subunit A [Crocinitomicaceae bacterium]|nr:DNA gyrase/topoisomerase IV subunit A [Crocinitomicaceae bacterium]NGF75445.1 DNA gyrase/topoisomerase IV subunit A [Fluviicola sp. SGL-29]
MAENEEENDQQFDENNEQNEQNESASTDFSGVHSRNTDEPEDSSIIPVSGLYENWFLDYASYVILERAVPSVHDGFKPVQRRILHSMKEMDDGRYNKVANIIGNTMKYHPHGDASIGDALVQLGQKDLLIDCQGNWGNTLTGDGAAAPRYIEARLTKFANHVVFNPKTTNWLKSYDGRNNEPEQLPVKFPLLLAQGAEGIAVGMACKILPHNFIELIDQSINHLRGKRVEIYPDFPNGGMADFSNYNDGLRGGKVRLRAKIKKEDSKTLIINEIPVGTTTSLIDSILKANDKGKIKIKKIEDNTAALAEIIIHLAPGVSPDKTIDALYAFTDCELSISPNASVIDGDRPRFIGVSEILKINTNNTVDLLRRELEIRMDELQRQWHFSTLEKIFINEEMYIDFKHYSDRESLYEYLYKRFEPFKKQLIREIVDEDLQKLTQIPMIRITRFDASKADELIAKIEAEMEEIKRNLENLIEYAIEYYKDLKKRFGEGRERKTEIKTFDSINATKVIIANKKLYVDYDEGFIGHGLKKAEYIADCSEIDDVIIFFATGKMMVTKVSDKKFVGKGIVYANVWKKGDKRTIYHMMYQDGVGGPTMMKRFTVDSITRDTEYDLTRGTKGSKLLYFSVHPNGEREIVTVMLRPRPHIKRLRFDIDFGALLIKGRSAAGNRVTKEIVQKIVQKEVGGSTLAARKIWYDEIVGRLNDDGRGKFLGQFKGNDKILTLYKSGEYRLSGFDLATHFDEDMIHIEKWHPDRPISAVYYDAEKDLHFVKRFLCEVTMDKKVLFISESEGSHLDLASTAYRPKARIVYNKLLKATKNLADTIIDIADFIDIKGMKAQGNQLTKLKIKEVLPEIPEGGEEPWPEEQAVEPVIDAESDTTEDTDEGESPTMEWDMTNDDDQPKLF